jgi:cation-dependent mannose-6-phosphate receptor
MHSPSLATLVLAALALRLPSTAHAASSDDTPSIPCTAKSPLNHGFYDLRPLSVIPPSADSSPKHRRTKTPEKTTSWTAKGHDYPANFSINICAPVIEDLASYPHGVQGVDKPLWGNVSAFYEHEDGRTYSIGTANADLKFRGRKLVLQYVDGSPCGGKAKEKERRQVIKGWEGSEEEGIWRDVHKDLGLSSHAAASAGFGKTDEENEPDDRRDDDDDEDSDVPKHRDEAPPKYHADAPLRKSTLISFHCERDPLKALAVPSFIGTDPAECAYFFEVRSPFACVGSAEPVGEVGLGPAGVFGVIALVAVLVYFIGGVIYNRSVGNARGWRQVPNYGMWAGIWGFFAVRSRSRGMV